MRLFVCLAGLIASIAIIGCSSNADVVDVPKSATEGGNVVKDPELRKQMLGSSGAGGGGQQQSGLTSQ